MTTPRVPLVLRRAPPPRDAAELASRARAIAGVPLAEIAQSLGASPPLSPGAAPLTHEKGKVGALLEAALGGAGASTKSHDFPSLGVELKTIPVGPAGRPIESTYVCTFDAERADAADWATSWVRAKLAHVLWVPILERARVGVPFLWRPSPDEEAVLREDFELLVGTLGMGAVGRITGRDGRALQLRPKARTGKKSKLILADDGETLVAICPMGFYLRASFTGGLLAAAVS